MRKSMLAWILAVLMVLSIPAVSVAAEETTGLADSDTMAMSQNDSGDSGDGNSGDSDEGSSGDNTEDDSGTGGQGNTGGSGEEDSGDGDTGDSGGTDDSDESGSDGDADAEDKTETTCNHAWVYVEVDPTCSEYGAKGYGCGLCGAVKDVVALDMVSHTYDHACDTSCNVCNASREIEHKYSSKWTYNSTKHWHACNICGARDGEGSHYPGPAATEEKAQYCLTCGLMMMPQKKHTHTYAAEFTSDETGHWYACGGCAEKKDFQPHNFDTLCDPDCNDCGFVAETAHSYGEVWKSDGDGHWKECVLCMEKDTPQPHVPGPEATDLTAQVCTVCAKELTPARKHAHEAAKQWESDEQTHWKSCSCGEKLEEAAHLWNEGVKQEEKSILFTCIECGAEKNEEAEAEAPGSFLWILLIVLCVLLVAAVAALAILLVKEKRKGKYHR